MQRASILERGRLVRGDSNTVDAVTGTPARRVLPRKLYDRLQRSEATREDRGEAGIFDWRRDYCLVGQWVGVIQVPGLQLEILPKTDDELSEDAVRSNLMEMLLRGELGAVRARGVADLALKRGTLHTQLVDAFLDRALFELQRGSDRGYTSEQENLLALRGKLVLSRHVTVNAAQRHRFYCRYDAMTEATPISICLKQACRALATRSLPLAVQIKCQQVLALLDDVPDVLFVRDAITPTFTRQNQRFEDVYGFARMLLEGQAPDAKRGDVETFSLLFDMEQVFERYLASFLQAHVVQRIPGLTLHPQAKGQRLSLFQHRYEGGFDDVLRMKPDLLFVLHGADDTKRALIIDTKWKRLPVGPARPANSDLYQLYAYLRRYDCERAFLLYPKVEGVVIRDLAAMAGAKDADVGTVGVRCVELGHKLWTTTGRAALADELESIVRSGFGLPPSTTKEVAA